MKTLKERLTVLSAHFAISPIRLNDPVVRVFGGYKLASGSEGS